MYTLLKISCLSNFQNNINFIGKKYLKNVFKIIKITYEY